MKGKDQQHASAQLLANDPVPWFLSANDPAITAMVERHLLAQRVDLTTLWELREALRLIGRQQANGWSSPDFVDTRICLAWPTTAV